LADDFSQLMVLEAVLFDFDGVIAETENYHIAAWQRTLSVLGWDLPDEEAARAAELDDREFLSDLFSKRGVTEGNVGEWLRRKQIITVNMLRAAPALYPGVLELVCELRNRVRLAIVSGTWRENVEAVLDATGLADGFELIIGKEDVALVKPDADAYLLALRRLKLPASATVALEDSPSGLASATAAGVPVIAVGHRRPFGAWVGSATYIAGLEPVGALLQQLGL
jgi:beta-phosphoglucomutase